MDPRLGLIVAAAVILLAAGGAHDVTAALEGDGVRVIVKVAQAPGTPLDRAQDVVLAELAGTSYRVLHRYLNSPFLALEVGADALRLLDRSPNVLSVARDIDAHPLAPGARR
jgi:hypothetical protein